MRAPSLTHRRARQLRRRLTLPEVLLWKRLKRREPGEPAFRRQHPVGPYILDFYCSEARLCIEVDGYSHLTSDCPERDARRDAYLSGRGISVVRYQAKTILDDPDDIAASIVAVARDMSSLSS